MTKTESTGLNVNRAVCVAAGLAEDHEVLTNLSQRPYNKNTMQAIHLKEYVKSLDSIVATSIPRLSFSSHISTLRTQPTTVLLNILVTHTAINHVDLLYAHGVHQNNKSGLFAPPFTLGLEFAGIVIDVRMPSSHRTYGESRDESATQGWKIGDRCWGGGVGSHAEQIIVPVNAVHRLPSDDWSLHDIAALGAATVPVSYGALTMIAGVKPGETVLVHAAAGGLGVYAVQIARAMGAKVIGTVGSTSKLKVVEDLLRDSKTGQIPSGEGAVLYSESGWEKKVTKLCERDGKDGVDVVIDTVGLVTQSIRCTKFNGRIVIVGFAARTGTGSEKVQELEKVAVNRLLLKQIKLLGYRYGETGRRLPAENEKMWAGLQAMLAEGKIKPVVYRTYKGLDQVAGAMRELSERKTYGKAVVEVKSEQEAMEEVKRWMQETSNLDVVYPAKL